MANLEGTLSEQNRKHLLHRVRCKTKDKHTKNELARSEDVEKTRRSFQSSMSSSMLSIIKREVLAPHQDTAFHIFKEKNVYCMRDYPGKEAAQTGNPHPNISAT